MVERGCLMLCTVTCWTFWIFLACFLFCQWLDHAAPRWNRIYKLTDEIYEQAKKNLGKEKAKRLMWSGDRDAIEALIKLDDKCRIETYILTAFTQVKTKHVKAETWRNLE